jgi:beta-carotene ketolase (CrtO type)
MKHRQTDFDAVVIGAGHNGLITAAYLARHGVSTLLVEARHLVGGTAASEMSAIAITSHSEQHQLSMS